MNKIHLPSYVNDVLAEIETDTYIKSREDALKALRFLGLNDFASVLWSMPNAHFPKVSKLLPKMASEDTQREWTGYVGVPLLNQSISFMRAISSTYSSLCSQDMLDAKILDYGSGYGRFLRLAMFYSNNVWGIDPWDRSIEECNSCGLTKNLRLSEYLPQSLPVDTNFNLIFAFSVFTHLSARATEANLKAMRKHISKEGLACITIRPIEYWRMAHANQPESWLLEKEKEHIEQGFAFWPHDREPIDGDITYGDTSFTLDWLRDLSLKLGWEIVATDRTNEDPVQRFVFLKPI